MEQQNKTYELTRIAMEDAFSTKPLNDNAEIVESALNSLDGAAADLTQRVTALGVKRMAVGTYVADGTVKITVGFRPKMVFAISVGTSGLAGAIIPSVSFREGDILDDGFQVKISNTTSGQIGRHGYTFAYLAVA